MSANEPLSSDDIPMDWEVEDSSSSESTGDFQGLIQAVLAATKAAIKNRRWARFWKRKRRIPNRTLQHPDNTGMQRLRDNPYESEWWRILENESIVDPDTNAGKEFRRDFRVPFKVFDFIYQEAKEATKENGSLTLLQKDGTPKQYRGLYLVTDNGYHRWRCLIPPMTMATNDNEITWSKHLESVRKDV